MGSFLLCHFLWNWMFTCTSVLLLFGVPIKFHTKFRSGVFCTHFHTVFQSCTFCIFSMAAFFRKPKIELEFLLLVLIYLYFWCLWLYCDILYQNSPLFRQNENKTWDKFEPNFSSPPGQGISYFQFLHQQLYHLSSTHKDSLTWSTVGGSHVSFFPNVKLHGLAHGHCGFSVVEFSLKIIQLHYNYVLFFAPRSSAASDSFNWV